MKEKAGVRGIATILLRELTNCFDRILKPSSVSFDPIYLALTYLDPKFKILLNREQLDAATSYILREVCIILFLVRDTMFLVQLMHT